MWEGLSWGVRTTEDKQLKNLKHLQGFYEEMRDSIEFFI